MTMDSKLLPCVLAIALLPMRAWGWGVIEVRFENYTNAEGTTAEGECCDKRFFSCVPDGCDYEFTICIQDNMDESDVLDYYGCGLYYRKTFEIDNQDSVVFGNRIADIGNPILLSRMRMPETMLVKVQVMDDDAMTTMDFIDFFRLRLDDAALRSTFTDTGQNFTINSRTTLALNIKSYCSVGYSGRLCDNR